MFNTKPVNSLKKKILKSFHFQGYITKYHMFSKKLVVEKIQVMTRSNFANSFMANYCALYLGQLLFVIAFNIVYIERGDL